MKTNSNGDVDGGATIAVDLPTADGGLFRSDTVDEALAFLARHHGDEFSVTALAEAIGYSRPAVTRAVDVLAGNDLVDERRDGHRRLVSVNRERLSLPDDPVLQIPQAEFHAPVEAATEVLVDAMEDVLAVVVYGSVARGDADRRSDIDCWVLVETDRMANQRTANRIRADLEERAFDGDRYAFEIDVEACRAIPNYEADVRRILREGIVVYHTDRFETVRETVLHGGTDD